MGSGLAMFGIVLVLMALAVGFFGPNQPVVQGIVGSFAGGIAGMSGFAAALLMLRRRPAARGGAIPAQCTSFTCNQSTRLQGRRKRQAGHPLSKTRRSRKRTDESPTDRRRA